MVRIALLLLAACASNHQGTVFLALGGGGGGFTGHGDVKTSRMVVGTFQGGAEITGCTDIVFGMSAASANYSPDPRQEQNIVNGLGGVRWFPFGRGSRGLDWHPIYLQGAAGLSFLQLRPYDELFSRDTDVDAAGLVASASAGWMPKLGAARLGFELRDDVIIYNNDRGTRQAFSALVLLQASLR